MIQIAENSESSFGHRHVAQRLVVLVSLILLLFGLSSFEPVTITGWLPLRASCGAITGLPCIFCGMTRALHFALRGEFERALYFNWLAFPALLGVIGLTALLSAEILLQQRVIEWRFRLRLTRSRLLGIFIALFALWTLQACLAVSQHKKELLNPNGPLYEWFVK